MTVAYSPLYGSDADDKLSPTYELDGDNIILHSTIYGGDGDDVITGEAEPLQTSRYASDDEPTVSRNETPHTPKSNRLIKNRNVFSQMEILQILPQVRFRLL